MPPRRKVHLPLTEPGEFDIGFSSAEDDTGPIASGNEDTDLLCGRCHKTLFLALTIEGFFAKLAEGLPTKASNRAAAGRRHPAVAVCNECGARNRLWPPPRE